MTPSLPFGIWEIGVTIGFLGIWGACYAAFMNAFPRMRVVLMTSPYPRRGAGAGECRDDGAAAGARVDARGGRRAAALPSRARAVYLSTRGALAQLGEHSVCNRKVASSSLARSILFSTDRYAAASSAGRSPWPERCRTPLPAFGVDSPAYVAIRAVMYLSALLVIGCVRIHSPHRHARLASLAGSYARASAGGADHAACSRDGPTVVLAFAMVARLLAQGFMVGEGESMLIAPLLRTTFWGWGWLVGAAATRSSPVRSDLHARARAPRGA